MLANVRPMSRAQLAPTEAQRRAFVMIYGTVASTARSYRSRATRPSIVYILLLTQNFDKIGKNSYNCKRITYIYASNI